MRAALRLGILSVSTSLLLTSCIALTGIKKDPEWVVDIKNQLSCGMTPEEVRALTEKELKAHARQLLILDPQSYDSYAVYGTWAHVNLHFQQGSLISILTTRVNGLASAESSPLVNLCTGELTYRIRLAYPYTLKGCALYLNEELMERCANGHFFLPPGRYEMRLEKAGFAPIWKRFELKNDRNQRGTIYLSVEGAEVVPLEDDHPDSLDTDPISPHG